MPGPGAVEGIGCVCVCGGAVREDEYQVKAVPGLS